MEEFVRKGHEGVKFFVGPEIEQTPAYNKKTLFVVGLQDTATIERLYKENGCKHIFLSANRSFDSIDLVNGVYKVGDTLASDWEKQIHELLDKGYMVSLDYPAHKHTMVLNVLNKGIWQSRNFVPVLSVAVPHVSTSSPNLTIKIDDINFGATNPGVWCMHHKEVTDSNRFTSWSEYVDDVIVGEVPVTQAPVVQTTKTVAKEAMAEIVKDVVEEVTKEVLNNTELGLDTDPKTALKPEETPAPTDTNLNTTTDAAEAYADGATADPVAAEAKKAPKAKK